MSLKTKINSVVTLLVISLSPVHTLYAAEDEKKKPVTIINPQKEIPPINAAAIDTERFEIGFYLGSLSVEDFGTNSVNGFSFSYHINQDFIIQASIGSSDIDKATFEEVVDQEFLASNDRELTYTQLLAGYQLFHGRSFFGAKQKFNSHLYLTAGIENIEFAGEKELGYVIGTTYKIVATDWLTWNFSLNNHIFERTFLGDNKITNNTELSIGLSALF